QAAYRGYRLRQRLRMLPAREAEYAIKALHRNSEGFRRLGMFLIFYALYFALVFTGFDIPFERAVEQGLRSHVDSVKFGAGKDRGYEDVSSLADFHEWFQSFFLNTYSGTQLESVCTPCAIRPPDEVCELCDFWGKDDQSEDGVENFTLNTSALSNDCSNCLVRASWWCGPIMVEACNITLGGGSLKGFDFTALMEESDSLSLSWEPMSSASPNYQLLTSAYLSESLNTTALAELDLTPEGGVSASTGYITVRSVAYNGRGYIANRNRIVGGMLLTFTRLKRDPACKSSRGYFDACLLSEEETATIVPDSEDWREFRASDSIYYHEDAGGYAIFFDTGGFNSGSNFGYCSLLLLEDLGILGNDTSSISVHLVTFNGHQKTAFGNILIDFEFTDGGNVEVEEHIASYVLQSSFDSGSDSPRWIAAAVFTVMALYNIRQDFRHFRRSRMRVEGRLSLCSCALHALILANICYIFIWAAIGEFITVETELSLSRVESEGSDLLGKTVLRQEDVAVFAASFKLLVLVTTMAGLHRLLFQKLTFHKRMSIVSDTLSRAGTNLQHFLFVFVLVLFVFVEVTWLIIGTGLGDFTLFSSAWQSMLRISLGEGENFYPQIKETQPEVGAVLIITYQVLGVVVLLSMVVAIILEAYRGVVVGMRYEDTVFRSLLAFLGMTILSWQIRIRWAQSYLLWRMNNERVPSQRPSLQVALQGSTGVVGVDGLPVVVMRTSSSETGRVERQLSYNCPRYITVFEMQALIKAAPAPAFIVSHVLRKIVHHWISHSHKSI
ncbi:unnamed protein product, partial [Sphacelaria rigidula]